LTLLIYSLESSTTKRYCSACIQRRLLVFVSSGFLRSVTYQPATLEHPCDSTAQLMDQFGEFLLGRRGDKVKGRCSRGGVEAVDPVDRDKVLAHPGCIDSIPSSAGKEDQVSMGSVSARKLDQIVENVWNCLAIEAWIYL
jgi:hypothetical protein